MPHEVLDSSLRYQFMAPPASLARPSPQLPSVELLFEVVSRAYERLSLIVTTNLPFESWTEVLGCERLTGALLDRLTHRVHIIEANGPSYRLRESKGRLHRPPAQPEKSGRTEPKQS